MARVQQSVDEEPSLPVVILRSRQFVGTGLLGVLGLVVLGTAVGGPEWVRSWLIASVLLAFAGLLIISRYWSVGRTGIERSYFTNYQLILFVGLLVVLYQSRNPGYGLGMHRGLEATAVFLALIAFCVLAGDPWRYDGFQWVILGCFAVVTGIFFYHSVSVAEVSVRSRHPVWWGTTAGVGLAVLPQYVSRESFLWALNRLAALLVLLGIPVYFIGEYSLFGLQFGFQGSFTIPLVEYRVQAIRSVFYKGNALATVVIAGLIAAVAEFHRVFDEDHSTVDRLEPGGLLAINAIGLILSFGKALWVITPMVLGIYLAYVLFDRRAVPVAVVAAGIYLVSGILAIYLGILDIDPSGRFRLWTAGIRAILHQPTLLGEGLIAPAQFIEEYHSGGQSPHNSYLSIWIRTGIVGGFAYLLLVAMGIIRGMWRYRDIDVAILALAVGYAGHHLFEAYTLFQTWSSSVLVALAFGMLIFNRQLHHHSQTTQEPVNGNLNANP